MFRDQKAKQNPSRNSTAKLECKESRLAVGRWYNPADCVQSTEQSQKLSDKGICVAIIRLIFCSGVLFLQQNNYLTQAEVFIPMLEMTEAPLRANNGFIFVLFEAFPRLTEEILGMVATKPGLFHVPGSYINH